MKSVTALVVAAVVVLRVSIVPNAAHAATTLTQLAVTVARGKAPAGMESFVVARPNAGALQTCWLSKETTSGKATFNANCGYGDVLAFSNGLASAWQNASKPALTVALAPRRKVDLNIHLFVLPDSAATLKQRISVWVSKATTIYSATNPIGFQFVNSGGTTVHAAADASLVGWGCSTVLRGAKASDPKSYYDSDRINIYVVQGVWDGSGSVLQGEQCGDLPNVIYLSQKYAHSGTLAHELGHALGLLHPASAPWGKSKLNLMVDGSDSTFNQLTAGQAVRTLLDSQSWVNNPHASTVVPGSPVPNGRLIDCFNVNGCPDEKLKWKLP